MNILIVGAGVSGCGAAELAITLGFKVAIVDQFTSEKLVAKIDRFAEESVELTLEVSSERTLELASWADEVVLSPGIDPNGFFAEALSVAKYVCSEMEFGARFCKCPLWCITGTNGKTTTVEMTAHIMNECGLRVLAAGNIGFPVSLAALESSELDGIVIEVSSFQLEQIRDFSPQAVAVLNISSDHINRYACFEDYASTKLKLLETVSGKSKRLVGMPIFDLGIPCADSEVFGLEGDLVRSEDSCIYHGEKIFSQNDLAVSGKHNFENAMVAAWFGLKVGLKPKKIAKSLKSFKTGAHRLEFVASIGGIDVFNDSKSTNPDSLIKAIEAVGKQGVRSVVLIAGGRDKNMDFSDTLQLVNNNVKTAILIGETKTRLTNIWSMHTKCVLAENMSEAVALALDVAVDGDTILLSPGCASQDMFVDYKERGKVFCYEISRRLENE